MNGSSDSGASRRDFLKGAAASGAMAALMASGNYAFAQGSDKIKVGIVGCGGRGTGAAADAMQADPGATLVAMGDVYQQALDNSLRNLQAQENIKSKIDVKPEMMFVGLDAYKHVIDSGIDVVLLTTPPGFRPQHIKYAVEKNKHIFAEKPVATDVVGVRTALEAVRSGLGNKCFVSGFCYRYASTHKQFYQRLHAGAIGPVRAIHATYVTGPVKPMPAPASRPAGMSDTEWQIRNWYNFAWLGGDGLIEQACHSIDKLLWAMKDAPPVRCVATGGRDWPNNEGNIFDHIDVFYEWPDGVRATMAQRQIPNCYSDNTDYVIGAKGTGIVHFAAAEMKGDTSWSTDPPKKSMYHLEHDALFAAIRAGKQINDIERKCRSTLAGLMGRMAAYTGQEITWEMISKSQEELVPRNLEWNSALAFTPMPVPGKYKFV